jgi:hypothetical protein
VLCGDVLLSRLMAQRAGLIHRRLYLRMILISIYKHSQEGMKWEEKMDIRREKPALASKNGDGYGIVGRNVIHVAGNVKPILGGHGIEFLGFVKLDDGDIAFLLQHNGRHVCGMCM